MPVGLELASCTLYRPGRCHARSWALSGSQTQVETSPPLALALAVALGIAFAAVPILGAHGRGAAHAAGDPLVGAREVGPLHPDAAEVGRPVLGGLLPLAPFRLQALQPLRQLALSSEH